MRRKIDFDFMDGAERPKFVESQETKEKRQRKHGRSIDAFTFHERQLERSYEENPGTEGIGD